MSTTGSSGSIGERVKAFRAQRRTQSLSPPNTGTSGDNLELQDSSSTEQPRKRKFRSDESDSEPKRRKKRTVWSQGYNEDSDGAESEADLSLATTPNVRRQRSHKAKEAGSSTADSATIGSSPTETTSTDDLEEGEILEQALKKVVEKSSAKKRKYVDGLASSADQGMPPSAKKQKINTMAIEIVSNHVSTQLTSTTRRSKTGFKETEPFEQSKKRKADDPTSTTDHAAGPSAKKLKIGTESTTAPKKPTSPKQAADPNKTLEKKQIRKNADHKKTSVTTKATKEAEQLQKREAPKKKTRLSKEYRNNSHLRDVINNFCITMGIGFFEDMEIEEQERLVKEMKKRSQYLALVDIRKGAVSSRTREENRWNNKGQHDNDSALFVHQRKLNTLQRSVDDAQKAIDVWEARDSNISYRMAYDVAVAGRVKKFKIEHTADAGLLGRRSAFFASRLPVEIWEKSVAEGADSDEASR